METLCDVGASTVRHDRTLMWLAIGLLAICWVFVIVYAALIAGSNDDDRAMRDYRAERDAFERFFE